MSAKNWCRHLAQRTAGLLGHRLAASPATLTSAIAQLKADEVLDNIDDQKALYM